MAILAAPIVKTPILGGHEIYNLGWGFKICLNMQSVLYSMPVKVKNFKHYIYISHLRYMTILATP